MPPLLASSLSELPLDSSVDVSLSFDISYFFFFAFAGLFWLDLFGVLFDFLEPFGFLGVDLLLPSYCSSAVSSFYPPMPVFSMVGVIG